MTDPTGDCNGIGEFVGSGGPGQGFWGLMSRGKASIKLSYTRKIEFTMCGVKGRGPVGLLVRSGGGHQTGLPWGWHFNPHTHPIPTGIPMGIPIPTAALPPEADDKSRQKTTNCRA